MVKGLEKFIEKHKVGKNDAEELRRRLKSVTSVDEGTFMHFYGLVRGKVGSGDENRISGIKRNKVYDKSKRLLNYNDARKYVAGRVMDMDASLFLTRIDCIERADDFFYRVSDIDWYLKKVRGEKLAKYKRDLKKEESLRIERELHEGVYR